MHRIFTRLSVFLVVLACACSPSGAEENHGLSDADGVEDASGDRDTLEDGNSDPPDVAQDGVDDAEVDAGEPAEPLDILFIGNSFTFGGPVPLVVEYLAVDAGWPEPNVEWSTFGGESLQGHRTREETLTQIDNGGWEVVVLQELSTRPTDNRGDPVQFKVDATWFHDRIKAASPGARVVLFETWARHADHGIYPVGFDDPAQMQAQLREHYFDCAERYIPENAAGEVEPPVEVAPVGDAWESHLAETAPLRLHAEDDYHAGLRGQYLNGLVIYGTIYRRATAGRSSWQISAADAERLQSAADRTTNFARTGGPRGGNAVEPGLTAGQVVRVDFGGAPTASDGWNPLEDAVSGELDNAVDASGDPTAVDITVSDGFSGSNEQGPTTNGLGYPGDVSSDTLWTGSFDGHDAALASAGQLTIRGLGPEQDYTLRIYAGRTGSDGGRGRLTRYTVVDETRDLEVADNVENVVEFGAVRSNALGEIAVDVTVSPAGSSRFAYIGALEIVGE